MLRGPKTVKMEPDTGLKYTLNVGKKQCDASKSENVNMTKGVWGKLWMENTASRVTQFMNEP